MGFPALPLINGLVFGKNFDLSKVDWIIALDPGPLPINLQFLPQCAPLSLLALELGHVTC